MTLVDEKRDELERIAAWLVEAWRASVRRQPRCGLCHEEWDTHDEGKCPAEALAMKLVELGACRELMPDRAPHPMSMVPQGGFGNTKV